MDKTEQQELNDSIKYIQQSDMLYEDYKEEYYGYGEFDFKDQWYY